MTAKKKSPNVTSPSQPEPEKKAADPVPAVDPQANDNAAPPVPASAPVDTPVQNDDEPVELADATEDPTNGELPPTEFPEDEFPDPTQEPVDTGKGN